MVELFLAFVVLGNLVGLVVLVAALLSATTADLSAGQLLASGAVVWLTNVIVLGLWFWTFNGGGPCGVSSPRTKTRCSRARAGIRGWRTMSTWP
jgi:hypothetical protein